MIEKIGPVRNPLTIIAMFAGIAEISGTVVLPFLAPQNQATYIWFLMLFPSALIALFFATLNFNHRALYAPSDYRDEDNFFRGVREGTTEDRIAKVKRELAEAETESTTSMSAPSAPSSSEPSIVNKSKRDKLRNYLFAEDLALNELSLRLLGRLRKGVEFEGIPYLFDGVVSGPKGLVAIEVKYVRTLQNIERRIRETVNRVASALDNASDSAKPPPFSLLISIVTDKENTAVAERDNGSLVRNAPFPVQVEVHTTLELMGLIRDFP